MREIQEDSERCTTRARAGGAQLLAFECVVSAINDELIKLQTQLRRSQEQSAEHADAQTRLRRQLEAFAAAFNDALAQERDAQEAMRQEVDQLRQVTEDLEGRLHAKALEIERLRQANAAAVACAGVARAAWQRAQRERMVSLDEGPLGASIAALEGLLARPQAPDAVLAGAAGAAARGAEGPHVLPTPAGGERLHRQLQDAIHQQLWDGLPPGKAGAFGEASEEELPAMRSLVKAKETQLAALHGKIRFLSEQDDPQSRPAPAHKRLGAPAR
eukprot:CAMPEP_0198589016 /NCGR_PEP_ID=MMETSP1462-20131121/133857_1 /TAXON_ID=1333877 /ORGANISM="Brandtodinium nutriculum, Strain RCC3387" /LENGTH=272 /DNA_ID=CAMNT_0044320525 /DNA_START=39 /DNA_END=854 /DNA_ORIENTATION=+